MSIDKSSWGYEQGLPSNTVEEVKELTAEEQFYNSEIEVPGHALYYITDLERNAKMQADLLKSKNQALKELLGTLKEARPELTYYIQEVDRILNLKS